MYMRAIIILQQMQMVPDVNEGYARLMQCPVDITCTDMILDSVVETTKSGAMNRLMVSARSAVASFEGGAAEKAMPAMGPTSRSSNHATIRNKGSKKRT